MKKKALALAGLFAILLGLLAAPALARTSYVQDGAGLFSSATVTQLNGEIGNFAASTGKEVVVVTVPSLGGTALANASENAFAQQSVNGILIFIAKAEHSDYIVGDRASHRIFAPGEIAHVRDAMNASFRTGDFDGGVTTAVNLILDTYRSHPLRSTRSAYGTQYAPSATNGSQGGLHVGFLWWILIIIAIFWVVRAIARSMSGGFGGGGGSGPGYGPGYGGGPGWGGGGGGGFWSGLLGGLGGAWIGNELFGQHGQGNIGTAGTFADPNATADGGAYQSDPGQADMSDASGGGWGGGGDAGGGWGGGGDFGGGGDSGGGW